jgi:hypothetical protein
VFSVTVCGTNIANGVPGVKLFLIYFEHIFEGIFQPPRRQERQGFQGFLASSPVLARAWSSNCNMKWLKVEG